MDDNKKHMLLMSAKAPGIKGKFQSWSDSNDIESCGIAPDGAPGRDWWNPISDDGTAFSLGVKLEMDIVTNAKCGELRWSSAYYL